MLQFTKKVMIITYFTKHTIICYRSQYLIVSPVERLYGMDRCRGQTKFLTSAK